MRKLNSIEESRMVDTVKAALSRCSKGGDPSDIVAKLALDQNLSSEEASRVCEAVNKVASINYLSDSRNDRSASFPLADSSEVVKLMKQSLKVAKEPFKFRKTASDGLLRTSGKMNLVTDEERKEYEKAGAAAEYSAEWLAVQAAGLGLKKASEELRLHEYNLNEEFIKLVDKIASLPQDKAEDAATYLVMAHGNIGSNFLTALENLTGSKYDRTSRAFVKTGSDVENDIDLFLKHSDQVLALRDVVGFIKTAKAPKDPKEAEAAALRSQVDKLKYKIPEADILTEYTKLLPAAQQKNVKAPSADKKLTDPLWLRAHLNAHKNYLDTIERQYSGQTPAPRHALPTQDQVATQDVEGQARSYDEQNRKWQKQDTDNDVADAAARGRSSTVYSNIPQRYLTAANNNEEAAYQLWQQDQSARNMARQEAYRTAGSIDLTQSWVPRSDVDALWRQNHGATPTDADRQTDEWNGYRRQLSNAKQQEVMDEIVADTSYLSPRQKARMKAETDDARMKTDKRKAEDQLAVDDALDNYYSDANGPRNHAVVEAKMRAKEHDEDRKWLTSQRTAQKADKLINSISDMQDRVGQALHETISGAIGNTKAGLTGAIGILQKADALRKGLYAPQLSGNKYSDPLSLEANKYLESLDMHDLFAKAYLSDPYLRQFSPSEVAEAFNIVHEVAPEIINGTSSPHIVSAMIRKYLANNNNLDPIELNDLAKTSEARTHTNLMKTQLDNLKRNKPSVVK